MALRYLGFCPKELNSVPTSVVNYVAKQLEVSPGSLSAYVQGATSAPKARDQTGCTWQDPAHNTELIDNVIQAGVARLVTSRILCMVKKNGLIVETRPLSKCCLNSIKATWKNI